MVTHAADQDQDGCACQNLIWFFIPLPHPLPLEDMAVHTFGAPLRQEVDCQGPDFAGSVRIHQLTRSNNPFVDEVSDIWTLGSSAFADERITSPPPPPAGGPFDSVRTVMEVALAWDHETNADELNRVLDRALVYVQDVQRGVAFATQGAVRLATRATIPPLIPIFVGAIHTCDGQVEPRVEAISVQLDGCAPPFAYGLRPPPLDEPTAARLEGAFTERGIYGAFATFTDLRRDAMVQRHLDGNARLMILALAAADEVMLDTILLHLLWEERTAAAEAATYFDRQQGHTYRVGRHFPDRLAGGWHPDAKSPAGQYLRDVVRLRHRVVHAGHVPTPAEVEVAWSTSMALERYVGDRLADQMNLRLYPRTAMAWMAENGLRQRGRWTKFMQEVTTDPREPPWAPTFLRWRTHVDRAMADSVVPPGSDFQELLLYVDRDGDGNVTAALHDPASCYAAKVDLMEVLEPDRLEGLKLLLQELPAQEHRVCSVPDRPPPAADWQPDHELFDELSIFPGPREGVSLS